MTYFIRIRGKAFGPFSEEQFKDMKANGKLSKTTEVSENKTDWQLAETLEFLYPPPPSPSHQSSSGSSTSSAAYGVQTPSQPAQEPADWYYSLDGADGYGPITVASIEQMLRSKQLSGNSYVWRQGENARLVKNEPRFAGSSIRTSTVNTEDMADIGGEITGTNEQVNTGKMLYPIAASLGWLMFLKITWLLIGVVVQGLYILWTGIFSISHAIGCKDDDAAAALFVTLIVYALLAGSYALLCKAFLCFWQYHAVLNQTVATGRASDLIQANQSQFLFWKWLGISTIVHLSVILFVATAMIIVTAHESTENMRILFRYVLLL